MFSSRTVIASLTLALLLTFPAAAATVSGTVSDAVSGERLQGMVVAAYDPAGVLLAQATTDATGLYVLPIAAGEVRLLAYDPSGVFATRFDADAESFETTPLVAVSTTRRVDFALVKGGRISGRVADPRGEGRGGLVVAAYNPSGTRRAFTKSTADGTYSIVLPPGSYRLAAYDESGVWATVFYPAVRTFAEAAPVAVNSSATTANVHLVTDRSAHLDGQVLDDAALPLAAMDVYAYTPEGALVVGTRTDTGGIYRMTLPAGAYRLVAADASRVHAATYYPALRSFEKAAIVAFAAGEPRSGVNFVLPRGALVSGRISGSGGVPLADIHVGAYNGDGTLQTSTLSDGEGQYVVVVAPGEVRIGASDASLKWVSRFYPAAPLFQWASPLDAVAGGAIASIDVQLIEGGRLAGVVRDAATTQPIAGAMVAAYDATGILAGQGRTAADGRYGFAVAPGIVRVVASDPLQRYAPAFARGASSYETATPLTLEVGRETPVDFGLRKGARVLGSVFDTFARPLWGVEIFALDGAGNRVAGATTVEGAFSITVVAGFYRFVAIDPAGRFARRYFPGVATFGEAREVSIVDGANPGLSFTLEGAGRRRSVRH
jgi:hypothetical protein